MEQLVVTYQAPLDAAIQRRVLLDVGDAGRVVIHSLAIDLLIPHHRPRTDHVARRRRLLRSILYLYRGGVLLIELSLISPVQ